MIRRILIAGMIMLFAQTLPAQEPESGMALIPGGEYMMGKDSDKERDFSPAHKVIVGSFYIDKHEVTNAEYYKFCQESKYKLPEFWNLDIFRSGLKFPDHTVVGVSWRDAQKYAEWAGKRLPTEAEWEHAARGGLVDNDFPNGKTWDKESAKKERGLWINRIEAVGKYQPNRYGLYDMGGNVWEWVADQYAEDYYKSSPVDNPKGSTGRNNRVIRSSSWHSGSMCKKVFYRKGLPSTWVDFAVGFRCVKDKSKVDK